MAFPNREISQLGSFLLIDDKANTIGIATTATPTIGIGTTISDVKLTVVGDTKLKGNLTVSGGSIESSYYTLNGQPLINAAFNYWGLASNGYDIYRDIGNIGIGASAITERLTVLGNVSAGQFISTVTSGTQPLIVVSDTQVANLNASYLRGKVPPSGNIIGDSDTQTLSNKTFSSPILDSPTITSVGIAISGSTSGTTRIRASSVASGIVTIPSTNDILIGRNTTDTLTNKIIAANVNTITGLGNSNLSGSAAISNANLANSTISGVSLGSTLADLTFGSYLNFSGSYNGSATRAISVAATTLPNGGTLVARDSGGSISVADISCSNLTGSFSLSGKDITASNSLSVNVGSAATISYGNSKIESRGQNDFLGSNSIQLLDNSANWNTVVGVNNSIDFGSGATENVILGYNNIGNHQGSGNVVLGRSSLSGSDTGANNNVAIGYRVFDNFASLRGSGNVAIGYGICSKFPGEIYPAFGPSAKDNVLLGKNSAVTIFSGDNNVAIGHSSLSSIYAGVQNIAIGSSAGIGIINSSQNVVIGPNRTVPILTGSNQLVIGAGNTNWINGNSSYNIGIGTTNPREKLNVVGVVSATSFFGDGSKLSGIVKSSQVLAYNIIFGL